MATFWERDAGSVNRMFFEYLLFYLFPILVSRAVVPVLSHCLPFTFEDIFFKPKQPVFHLPERPCSFFATQIKIFSCLPTNNFFGKWTKNM